MVRPSDFTVFGCTFTHVSGRYQLRQRSSRGIIRNIEYRLVNGANIWKSTGTQDICKAGDYVENLLINNGMKTESRITFGEFADRFFIRTDINSYRKYMEGFGYYYNSYYYIQRSDMLNNHIMPRFRDMQIKDITAYQIEMWYTSLQKLNNKEQLASDTKLRVLSTLSVIMDFALKKNVIDINPCDKVHSIKRINKERMPFTREEISRLFPKDYDSFLRIWGYDDNPIAIQKTKSIESWALMWGLYFSIMTDTGFRPGEVAAITRNSFIGECGVYVDSSVDSVEKRVKNSIKTTNKGQKYKVGILSDYTIALLDKYKRLCSNINMFQVDGGVITSSTSNKHLKLSAKRAGIELNGRTQYCLRHSFDTYMLANISDTLSDKDILRLMGHVGYRKEYDHRTADDIIRSLSGAKSVINSMRA